MRVARAVLALVAGLALCAATRDARAQEPVRAAASLKVTDARTGAPVVRATVTVKGMRSSWLTDTAGVAAITGIAPGDHTIVVQAVGYAKEELPVPLEGAAPLKLEVSLSPDPVALKALSVEAQRRNSHLGLVGFYDRQKLGGATFITGERVRQLQKRTNQLVELLRAVSGFQVVPNRDGQLDVVSSRGIVSINQACYPQVFLDGIKIPYPSQGSKYFNEIVPLAVVTAIEAYPGAAMTPAAYGRHPCGTILIWMAHGPD